MNEAADHIWIDTLSIGDGAMGKRSERLGMPGIFAEHELSKWYRRDLHEMVERYLKKYLPSNIIRVSKNGAFPR